MGSTENSDDPMQIALETLTERCKQFEQRVIDVEAENARLKLICAKLDDTKQDSLNEIDILKQKNSQLREHNTQLKSNIQMVASENRQLWSRLTKLMEVNQKLGSKLNKINDSLIQHEMKMTESSHTPLIRSKTFTQNEPYLKYQQKNVADENTKISLELEDISLKLINSIAKEKNELEAQYNEMVELQTREMYSTGFGFSYPGDDLDESILENLEKHVNDLKSIKQNVLKEKQLLLDSISFVKNVTVENKCKICLENEKVKDAELQKSVKEMEKTEDTCNGIEEPVKSELNASSMNKEDSKIMCPMCSKVFLKQSQYNELEVHVESHFLEADNINNFVVI